MCCFKSLLHGLYVSTIIFDFFQLRIRNCLFWQFIADFQALFFILEFLLGRSFCYVLIFRPFFNKIILHSLCLIYALTTFNAFSFFCKVMKKSTFSCWFRVRGRSNSSSLEEYLDIVSFERALFKNWFNLLLFVFNSIAVFAGLCSVLKVSALVVYWCLSIFSWL